MKNIANKADRFTEGILLIGCMPSLIILICIIGLFRSCMGIGAEDIDNSYMKNRYEYDRINITDSTGNGYELLIYTTETVTEARYREIQSRKHLHESYKRLKTEAADHFNHNLINTDIYDFAKWAKRFDIAPDTVRLVNIFVYGSEYKRLYRRANPVYPDGVHLFDDRTDLGDLYIIENDIYPYNPDAGRTYRYWGCDATSLIDERHTHITDNDRRRSRESIYDSYFREKELERRNSQ